MFDTILTENPIKKPTIITSIQTTCHQSLKKVHNQLKKDAKFCHHQKIFSRVSHVLWKMPKHSGQKTKLQYQQAKEIKTKRRENVTLFDSTHYTASP